MYIVAPKSSNSDTYKDGVKLDVERLKQWNTKSKGGFE